jgi:RNA polymerase sigma factor (sigma-70 family)
MFQPTSCSLFSQWFASYDRLAYWLARRWCARLLGYAGRFPSSVLLAELAQDAVARGFDRFKKRCSREVCGEADRKRWICQCVIRGARDAVRAKSAFGSLSDACAVRDDAMNRLVRANTSGCAHGSDEEKAFALELVADQPAPAPVQRWEIDALVNRELPEHLRATALYAACSLTQQQSATLQGVSDRTVRNRLREIAETLNPLASPYAVLASALEMVRAEL